MAPYSVDENCVILLCTTFYVGSFLLRLMWTEIDAVGPKNVTAICVRVSLIFFWSPILSANDQLWIIWCEAMDEFRVNFTYGMDVFEGDDETHLHRHTIGIHWKSRERERRFYRSRGKQLFQCFERTLSIITTIVIYRVSNKWFLRVTQRDLR